jgi:hypothetical protein
VHEVRFVDEEHGECALAREVFDMSADGMEDVTGSVAVGDVERVAEVAVEITPTESNVVAVGQAPRA